MIYRVTVREANTGRVVDNGTFPVGEWKEIGFWLNDLGYIEKGYTVTVEIGEVNDFLA